MWLKVGDLSKPFADAFLMKRYEFLASTHRLDMKSTIYIHVNISE